MYDVVWYRTSDKRQQATKTKTTQPKIINNNNTKTKNNAASLSTATI
jgi:hypothetical protein